MTDSGSQINSFPSRRLTAKLAWLGVLATLAMALAIGGASVYSAYAPLKQRSEETFAAVLELSGERVLELFGAIQANLNSIARHPQLVNAMLAATAPVEGADASGSDLSELLARTLSRMPEFDGLLVIDPRGTVIANTGIGPSMEGALDALRHKEVTQGERLLEIMSTKQLQKELAAAEGSRIRALAPGAGPRVVIATSTMLAADGALIGSLLGLVRQQVVADRLGTFLLGADGNVALVDEQGRLISAARDVSASEVASPAEENPDQVDTCRSRVDWGAGWNGAVACTLSLGALGWALVAQQPVYDVYRPLFVMLPAVLIAASIVAFGLTLLASWVATTAVRPLGELHRGIIAVAQGDSSTSVSDQGAPSEVKILIGAFNRLARRLGDRRQEFESSERALKVQNQTFQQKYESVSELSVTDTLTQLHNRRFFEEYLDCKVNRLGRQQDDLCLLVIDIDDFKQLNDSYGHAAGDEFLKQIARIMKDNVRDTDLIARFGGEEFIVVANGATVEGAMVLAEKIRTSVAESSFIVDDSMRPRRATISIGLARYEGSQPGLFNAADAALYRAKKSGKNCVVTADA